MSKKNLIVVIMITAVLLSGTAVPLGLAHSAYAGAPASAPGEEPVYFNETGSGGPWSLNVSNISIENGYNVITAMRTYGIFQPSMVIYLSQGYYGYTAYVALPGRLATVSNLFQITNSSTEIALNFSEYSAGYRVSLNVTGLPQGASWSPFIGTVSGMYLPAIKGPETPFLSNNSYEIFLSNGTYEYAVSSDNGAFYNRTWIVVQGKPVNAILQMQMKANPIEFQAMGLLSNESWQFNFTNVHFTNSNSTVFPFMLRGNESRVFNWGQGFVNFTVSAPQGYVLTGMSINVLHFNTTANGALTGEERNVTINISGNDSREFNYSFWIGSYPAGPIFSLIVLANSSIHLTCYFKQASKSITPTPFPWWIILLIVGIITAAGGIMEGNHRRRIKRGYKENEKRKQTPQPQQEPDKGGQKPNPDEVLREGEK